MSPSKISVVAEAPVNSPLKTYFFAKYMLDPSNSHICVWQEISQLILTNTNELAAHEYSTAIYRVVFLFVKSKTLRYLVTFQRMC